MYFELTITRRAQIDLDEIFVWYEERQSKLGLRFIEEVESAIVKINHNPYFAFNVEEDARATSLKKFPYEIIYRINEYNR